jgi:uncharacterized protein involved in response to NO
VLPGFLTGAALPVASLAGRVGSWWPAVAQAHGHAQLFGFAGLMVFGVGFHFLPRLRGAPLAAVGLVPWVLALFGGGLSLRALAQILGPLLPAGSPLGPPLLVAFALSGPLTLGGALAGLFVFVRSATRGPPLRARPGFLQAAPLLAAGGAAFLLCHVLNALGVALAATRATWLVPPALDGAVVRVAFLGWLVPVAAAFSARGFPLFLWTRPALPGALRASVALLLVGLLLAVAGDWADSEVGAAVAVLGRGLEGVALLGVVAALNVLTSRVTPPGRQRDPAEARLAEATRWPLVGAYAWLTVAGVLLLLQAVLPLAGGQPPPEDAVRHALGAGYVLLLVVGMGLRFLPGFAGGRGREVGLGWAWVAIAAAHTAALLRVLPVLAGWLTGAGGPALLLAMGGAGIAGAVAVVAFAGALRPALRPPAPTPPAT